MKTVKKRRRIVPRRGVSGVLGRAIAGRLSGITLEKVTEIGFSNAERNAASIAGGKSLLETQEADKMSGDSALVIAAGPSLHKHPTADIIKKSGYDGMIITTESAMGWCLRNGIVPHWIVTLDPHPERIVRWFGDPKLTEGFLALDDYFARQDMDPQFWRDQMENNRELVRLVNENGPKIRAAVSSTASQSVVDRVLESGMRTFWWNPMFDDFDLPDSLTRKIHKMNGLPCLNSGGNVGTACWVLAHAVFNKKKIGLVGMDFGYYSETPYSRTQYYKEILALVGPRRLDEVYVRLRNPHLGRDFYTDPAYLWYRNGFLEMTERADCETFNCTGGGILFGKGICWADLGRFLSQRRR